MKENRENKNLPFVLLEYIQFEQLIKMYRAVCRIKQIEEGLAWWKFAKRYDMCEARKGSQSQKGSGSQWNWYERARSEARRRIREIKVDADWWIDRYQLIYSSIGLISSEQVIWQ